MGIMTSKDINNNSELNRRIASDLRVRTQSMAQYDDEEDEEYRPTETKKTGRFTWVWIVLIVLAIISLICIAFI